MVRQLEESMEHDCNSYVDLEQLREELANRPVEAEEYRKDMILSAKRALEYALEELQREEKRKTGHSQWVQDLRNSLK